MKNNKQGFGTSKKIFKDFPNARTSLSTKIECYGSQIIIN